MQQRTLVSQCLVPVLAALVAVAPAIAAPFSFARIYIEYNDSANDLGLHVSMDGPNWKTFNIVNPKGVKVWEVVGRAADAELGMTELFFEGAEPNLDEFPLSQLLARFPEGGYKFTGIAIGGTQLKRVAMLSHAIPDGPEVEVPEEYVESLPRGEIPFEVLAIDRSGNQSITEGTFELD